MKHTKKYIGATAFAMFAGLMASCTNELDAPTAGGNTPGNTTTGVNIVKAPDVVAWSGEQTLGNNYGVNRYSTRSGNPSITKWQWDTQITGWPETTGRGEQVSEEEYFYVMKYLSEHPNEGYLNVNYQSYFLQNVGSSYNTYKLAYMNGDSVHHTADVTGGNQMDYLVINGMHVNDYNAAYGPRVYVENLPLENPTYHDSYANLTIENKYRFYYIPNKDGNGYKLYLCFDYSTKKSDNGELDYAGDGVYNDWVIRIFPGDGSPVTPPGVNNGDSNVGDGDDNNGDDNNGDDNNGDDNTDADDDNTITYYHDNEVEVNYAILDSHELTVADLVTKLSIHVRKATDVEIIIPIPTKYVIESDDLYIFQEHYTGSYGGSKGDLLDKNVNQTVTYNVAGTSIDLHVEFFEGGEDGGYIKVWTNGIDDTVISYLKEKNGDGINFEVYNYFQTSKKVWNDGDDYTDGNHSTVEAIQTINREALFEAMNGSTIKFLDDNPNYYINAFGWNDEKDDKHKWHATVTPIDRISYPSVVTTTHLNSTPFNDIYTLKGVEADHAHKEN